MTTRSAVRVSSVPARVTLIILEVLLGGSAVYGTVGLLTGTLGMPDDWLTGTPFTGWFVPALALLVVVALPMLGAAALEAMAHPWAAPASVVAGVLQVGWIAVQLLMMQRYFVLQPVVLILAALILLVTGLRRRGPSTEWVGRARIDADS